MTYTSASNYLNDSQMLRQRNDETRAMLLNALFAAAAILMAAVVTWFSIL